MSVDRSRDGIDVRRRSSSPKEDREAKLVKIVLLALAGLGVPRYPGGRSNRVYSCHAKLALLVLKQYLGLSYRDLCDHLNSVPRVMRTLGMAFIPDHSTMVRFSSSVDDKLLDSIIATTASMVCGHSMTAAMDATGFSCSNASRHFAVRMKQTGSAMTSVRDYTKASFAVDTETLSILACVTSESNVSDIRHVPEMLDKLSDAGYGIRYLAADRGYDAEYVHLTIRKKLNAEAVIPARRTEPKKGSRTRTTGVNRSRMKRELTEGSELSKVYGRRSLAETVNSMIKRKSGDAVYGRNGRTRHTEVVCRCIAHNIRRIMDLGMMRDVM